MAEPWGRLTQREVYDSMPPGTLPGNLRTWNKLATAIRQLSGENLERICRAAEAKEKEMLTRKRRANTIRMANVRAVHRRVDSEHDINNFMALPSEEEKQKHLIAFLEATRNNALRRAVCVVCARELMGKQGK